MSRHTAEKRPPLKYHFPTPGHYGRGVCGAHGMMAGSTPGYEVTCERCKRSAIYQVASHIASRYSGVRK
jgi:hypothetical protein